MSDFSALSSQAEQLQDEIKSIESIIETYKQFADKGFEKVYTLSITDARKVPANSAVFLSLNLPENFQYFEEPKEFFALDEKFIIGSVSELVDIPVTIKVTYSDDTPEEKKIEEPVVEKTEEESIEKTEEVSELKEQKKQTVIIEEVSDNEQETVAKVEDHSSSLVVEEVDLTSTSGFQTVETTSISVIKTKDAFFSSSIPITTLKSSGALKSDLLIEESEPFPLFARFTSMCRDVETMISSNELKKQDLQHALDSLLEQLATPPQQDEAANVEKAPKKTKKEKAAAAAAAALPGPTVTDKLLGVTIALVQFRAPILFLAAAIGIYAYGDSLSV